MEDNMLESVNNNGNSSLTSSPVSTKPDAWQVTHLVFLLLICILGTFGNIMTIIAVKIERKLRESLSNMFVVNLAIADLLVCSTVVPMMLAHYAQAETWFGPALCYVTVSISGVACHTAAATMTCIALTRYIAASRSTEYHSIVTRKRVFLAIGAVWLFAVVNSVPILLAWIQAGYDVTKYVCVCFDGTFPLYYTLGPVFIGHFFPHATTIYCYCCIMLAMRRSRRRFSASNTATMETATSSVDNRTNAEKRKSAYGNTVVSESGVESQETPHKLSVRNWSKHELQLLKTSMWIIGFFSFCWIPYGILVLLQDLAPIELKKTFAAFCLLSFSLNPVLYGLLSKSFRHAYHRILRKVFCNFCKACGDSTLYSSNASSSSRGIEMEASKSSKNNQEEDEAPKKQYGRGIVSA